MKAEEYFKKCSENCRLFENYHPIHSHEDMINFAEAYHKAKVKKELIGILTFLEREGGSDFINIPMIVYEYQQKQLLK